MLCGAQDTELVREEFAEECRRFQFAPWTFLDGSILHSNGLKGSWEENSIQSITAADIAIFVIIQKLGQIAWETEFRAALETGTPTELFCLQKTYDSYLRKRNEEQPFSKVEERLHTMVEEHKTTVITFTDPGDFRRKLQEVLSRFVKDGMAALAEVNRRRFQRMLVHEDPIPDEHLAHIRAIAIDEFEAKNLRKRAIDRLVERQYLDESTALELMESVEQGVARKVMAMTSHIAGYASPEFLIEAATIANESDDVGMERRLIQSLGELPWRTSAPALAALRVEEVGAARRMLKLLGMTVRDPDEALSVSDLEQIEVLVDRCESYQASRGGINEMAKEVREAVNRIRQA